MSNNYAAILKNQNEPLVVEEVAFPTAEANQIVVRTRAIAVNPVDYFVQITGSTVFPWIKLPFVLGSDVAGEVVAVGPGVQGFNPGDHVVGYATGMDSSTNSQSAFQNYVVLNDNMTAALPKSTSYESVASIPMAVSTASTGLFLPDHLALEYPQADPSARKPTGKTLLIWGGATSVGCAAIQLAVAAGYEVITTSSPRNFEYMRRLGAATVFDYNSPTVRDDLLAAFSGKTCAGALAIAGVAPGPRQEAAEACLELVSKAHGDKFVALAMPMPESLPEGVRAKFIYGSDIKKHEVGRIIYNTYLPEALAKGSFVPPTSEVVGNGLGAIQGALDTLKEGVSAKKLVVRI